LQVYGGVSAKSKQFTFATEAVFHPPEFASSRGDFQVQATPVKDANGFLGRLGIVDNGVCQIVGQFHGYLLAKRLEFLILLIPALTDEGGCSSIAVHQSNKSP
jgi:hypothetical protein